MKTSELFKHPLLFGTDVESSVLWRTMSTKGLSKEKRDQRPLVFSMYQHLVKRTKQYVSFYV